MADVWDQFQDAPEGKSYDTHLDPAKEKAYRVWMNKIGHTKTGGYRVDDNFTGQDYDYRGFFQKNGPVMVGQGQHFTDEFKKPAHETFSNESQYAVGEDAARAGKWDGETFQPPQGSDPWAQFQDADAQPPAATQTKPNTFSGDPLLSDESMASLASGAQSTVTPSPKPSPFRGIKDYLGQVDEAVGRLNRAPDAGILGTAEALGTMATGGIVAPVLGTAESIALGTPPEESFARYTYQPRTESGRAQLGVLGAVISPLTESGTDIALAPLLAGESRAISTSAKIPRNASRPGPGRDPIPAQSVELDNAVATGQKVSAPAAQAGRAAGLASVSQKTPVQAAREAGFSLKPSEAGAKTGAVVEGLTGSAKLETALAAKNQRNSNRLIREEFKLPDGPITSASLNNLKKTHNAVYQEVSKLGDVPTSEAFRAEISSVGRTPGKSFQKDINKSVEELKSAYIDESRFSAADAVLKVRELRYKANKNIGNRDPAAQELGYAQRAIADAIDNQLERHATELGKGDLVSRFRQSRQELARIHSLEAASRSGEVSAPVLAKMLDRGVPLSGSLRTIAETARAFPNVMREGRKLKGNTPVNMAETFVGLGGAAAIHPGFLAAAFARPAARAVLASERYQNSLAKRSARNAVKEAEPAKPKRNALADF
jgi:hypothetical protein